MGGVTRSNGKPLVEIYGKHNANNKDVQGGIISLNFLHSDGSYIGYYEIQTASAKQNIHIRTGCHCNPGACRKYLHESDEVLRKWERRSDVMARLSVEKDSCSDTNDMVNGHPVGGSRRRVGCLTTSSYLVGLFDDVQRHYDVR